MLILIILLGIVLFAIGNDCRKEIKGEPNEIGNDEGIYGIGNH
jgi:hypothetical protein